LSDNAGTRAVGIALPQLLSIALAVDELILEVDD
jgi:hypothetical protein